MPFEWIIMGEPGGEAAGIRTIVHNGRRMETFDLTEEHIKLLRGMSVRWSRVEYGAPAIDPKRPFGNSGHEQIMQDIGQLLDVRFDGEDDDGCPWYSRETQARFLRRYQETAPALQVVLTSGSFEPGTYITEIFTNNWRKIDNPYHFDDVRDDE